MEILLKANVYQREDGKSSVWYFRINIPKQYQQLLGRAQVRGSTNKLVKREAEEVADLHAAEWSIKLNTLISQQHGKTRLTPDLVPALAELAAQRQLADFRERYESGQLSMHGAVEQYRNHIDLNHRTARTFISIGGIQVAPPDTPQGLRESMISTVIGEVQRLTQTELARDDPLLSRMAVVLSERLKPVQEYILARLDGNASAEPTFALVSTINNAPSPSAQLTLMQVLEDWARDRRPDAKTVDGRRIMVRIFHELLGEKSLHDYTTADIRLYKERLLQGYGERRAASPRTVENHLTGIKALFAYAARERLIPDNPAAGVQSPKRIAPKLDRNKLPFSDAALKTLLTSAPFQKINTQGPRRRGMHNIKLACLRWGFLLGIYQGMRLEEIFQLKAGDLVHERGVWCLRIEETDSDQGVKNASSKRRVPLHPVLIKSGFVAFAQRRGLNSRDPIFAVPPDRYSRYGSTPSKWLNAWLAELGIKTGNKERYHTSRHTFVYWANAAAIPRNILYALSGHTEEEEGANYAVAADFPLPPLIDAIAKIDPGVDTAAIEESAADYAQLDYSPDQLINRARTSNAASKPKPGTRSTKRPTR